MTESKEPQESVITRLFGLFFGSLKREDLGEFRYMSESRLIEFNIIALYMFPDKKSDRHEVLNRSRIRTIAADVQCIQGDVYDKAIYLLRSIASTHAFASGNRRTALLVAIYFLKLNGIGVFIKNDPKNSEVLLALRNVPAYYSDDELKTWIKTGEIKPYDRQYPAPKPKKEI